MQTSRPGIMFLPSQQNPNPRFLPSLILAVKTSMLSTRRGRKGKLALLARYVPVPCRNFAHQHLAILKRTVRRLSLSSESSLSDGDRKPADRSRRVKASSKGGNIEKRSSSPQSKLKRKHQAALSTQPMKRKKPSESGSSEDPTRKYCLGKLQEVFDQIFLKYPLVSGAGDSRVEKNPEELTEEERAQLKIDGDKFAVELEQCVFDIYSEKQQGRLSAGGKYKYVLLINVTHSASYHFSRERFRMLQFNLSKPDRVTLHKRIVSAQLTPKEISLMSSTDLANEETKQSIKIAEKESLEHSILQKAKVPRAKITHKGLQDIEDLDGDVRVEPEIENEREEERREQERMARFKAAPSQQQPGPLPSVGTSGSEPPSTNWGEPPPLQSPLTHSMDSDLSPVFSRPPTNPLFIHTTSDFVMEPELNLADLINIDEDSPTQDGSAPASATPSAVEHPTDPNSSTPTAALPDPSPKSPIGPSPFVASAHKPEPLSRSSFDLNALWTAPKTNVPVPLNEDQKNSFVVHDIVGEGANDQDFDMFLEKDQDDISGSVGVDNSSDAQQIVFDGIPQVWSGMVCQTFVS